MVVPPGPDFAHPVLAIWVVGFCPFRVPEGAAADTIDADEKHQHDDAEDGKLVPGLPHFLKNPSFARVAVIAKDGWDVVPPIAIRVLSHRCGHVVDAR